MKTLKEKINWIIDQHKNTNHLYEDYLPYEFHLRMVVGNYEKFKHLIDISLTEDVLLACWAHDTIEDTRVRYNDVKQVLGHNVAEMVYAVTNEKGKNRKERASETYYKGIRETKYADFIKMCDRIANVEYSKMFGTRMFEMYKRENKDFIESLGLTKYHLCYPMKQYLDNVFDAK